jgi:hypothetical protein
LANNPDDRASRAANEIQRRNNLNSFGSFLNRDDTDMRSPEHANAFIQIIELARAAPGGVHQNLGRSTRSNPGSGIGNFFRGSGPWFRAGGPLGSFRSLQPGDLQRHFGHARTIALRIYDRDHSAGAGRDGEHIPAWVEAAARLREELNNGPTLNGNAANARRVQNMVVGGLIGRTAPLGPANVSAVDGNGNVIPQPVRNERSHNSGNQYAAQVIGGAAAPVRLPPPAAALPVQDRDDIANPIAPPRRGQGAGAGNFTGTRRRNLQQPSNAGFAQAAGHRDLINSALAGLGHSLGRMNEAMPRWNNNPPQPIRSFAVIAEDYLNVQRMRRDNSSHPEDRVFFERAVAGLNAEVECARDFHRRRSNSVGVSNHDENRGGNEQVQGDADAGDD